MSYALLSVTLLCAPVTIVLLAVRCDRHPWHDINNQCSALVGHNTVSTISLLTTSCLVPSLASRHSFGYHF